MEEIPLLKHLVVLLAATIPIVFLFQKAKLPLVVGFLVTGMVIGPYGLRWVEDTHHVEALAEIGIVLLLFVVGLEFSLGQLLKARRDVLLAGGGQVVLTAGATFGGALCLGYSLPQSILLGFLVSLSSTAIVFKLLTDRAEIDSPQGRVAVAILLFQDLCVVPMMLLVPMLGRGGGATWGSIVWTLVRAMLALAAIAISARVLLPRLLHQVARLRVRELFTLVVVFICLGTAWASSALGLSLGLGAFIAGLVIAESEYSHQIISEVLPLRDALSGIFFISVGMLLRLDFVFRQAPAVLVLTSLILSVKLLGTFWLVWKARGSARIAALVSMSLAQIGEFSFLLARAGRAHGILGETQYQGFLASAVLTMMLTPFLVREAPKVAFRIDARLRPRGAGKEPEAPPAETLPLKNHVIIVGFGLNGVNVARVLKKTGIPYVVIELNADTVRHGRNEEVPIEYGDSTRPEVLEKAGTRKARVLVVAISDPVATRRTVLIARGLSPDLHILVRTRFVSEIDDLYRLGASQVIPEEFETSIEIFSRVLREYHIPRNVVALEVDLIRRERYGMMRGLSLPARTLDQLQHILAATTTDTYLVLTGSPAASRTLGELNLRGTTGASIIAAVRDDKPLTNPGPDFRIEAGDVLVVVGSHAQIDAVGRHLAPEEDSDSPP